MQEDSFYSRRRVEKVEKQKAEGSTVTTGTDDRITEILAKAWLVCDPNRGCSDPDEPDSHWTPPHELAGKPRWHWFIPRAEALRDYLSDNGLVVRKKENEQ